MKMNSLFKTLWVTVIMAQVAVAQAPLPTQSQVNPYPQTVRFDVQKQALALNSMFSIMPKNDKLASTPTVLNVQKATPRSVWKILHVEEKILEVSTLSDNAEQYMFPLSGLLDTHYRTNLKRKFGASEVPYSMSGQEEQPRIMSTMGPLVLFMTPDGGGQQISVEMNKLKGGKDLSLGGGMYTASYDDGGNPLIPLNGKLDFKAKDATLKSYQVKVLEIVNALYKTSKRLQESLTLSKGANGQRARGQAPFRIAVFSKYLKPNEFWVMIMKDGADIMNHPVRDFRRTRFNSVDIPVNQEGSSWKVITDEFSGYKFGIGLVESKGSRFLYLRAESI
ncbi:MAG: hypothetical protein AABZ44_09775 [Elusimicrobiota bacterium]